MTSRLSAPSLRKGLKAPSVHVGPSRPGAPPSATGSSSSATSASGMTAPQGYGARGGRTMSMASSGYGQSSNQPSREHEEPSRPPLPAPLQRASTTSALTSSRAPLGGAMGGLLGGGAGLGLPSMKTDNIRVVLRIRPGRKPSNGNQYEDPDEYDDGEGNQGSGATRRCLEVADSGAGVTIGPGSMQEKRFAFDRVFDDASSQEDIFQDTGLMAVENTLNGFNGCIFAYGQTGSGKTFTMLGGGDSGSQHDGHELKVSPLRGLMPRIFDHLIRRLEDLVADDSNDLEYTLSCSYLEIYNEKVFDLLEVGSAAAQQPKSLREDSTKKTVYVDQLRQIPIKSATEAIEWLQIGSRNRRMASTDMNRESSRSHAVFTIRLLQTHHTERGVLITRRSNLHLVDLAGSEKQRQTKAAGQRLKEAAQINKSLSALGNVIMALVDVSNGLKRHVHYRDSKLTFLLRDSLGGNSITTIIATISAEEKYFSETLSTLKFAQRAKFIKNKAVQNEDSDAIIPLLKHEIERLRQEIEALKQNSQSDDGSPQKKSSEHESSYPQPYGAHPVHNGEVAARPRANKWEPALEMMERLLKASGAAAPENGDNEQDIFILELRCQRLEMLLYRMICRFEEQKVMTFSGARARPGIVQPPTPTISRAPSMLRKPKIKVGRNDGQDDDARSTRSTRSTASTSNNNADMEQELYEQTNRNAELDAENSLLRQQLAEFMEWKTLVMDERRRSSIGSFNPAAAASQAQTQAPSGGADVQELLEEQRERNEELLEALNGYRSMFADLNTALDEKRYRESTSSPSASGSTYGDDRSVSGVSVLDDDNESVASEDNSADLDEDVFGSEREMRRIQNLSIKFDRRIEKYQDKIQQLERNLLTVQDELETSTAATKFAQFQLEQFRNSASRQEDIELELGELRDKYRRLNKKTVDLERELSAKQVEVDGAFAKVHETDEMLRKLEEENSASKEEIKKLRGSNSTTEPELDTPVVTTHSNQIDDEEGDRTLVSALRRIRELEEQIHRQRSSSIASSLNGSLLDHEVAFSESRARAQSTSAVGMTGLSEYEIKSSFETHQQLQKVLHGVLADNTDLIKTVRELQTEKGAREQEHMKEVARLREECDSLRKRLDEMRELAVTSISPSKQAKQKAETDVLVARLRSERKALQTRLHQAQQQVRNLEDELTRSQSINATRSSIAADFFCEM